MLLYCWGILFAILSVVSWTLVVHPEHGYYFIGDLE